MSKIINNLRQIGEKFNICQKWSFNHAWPELDPTELQMLDNINDIDSTFLVSVGGVLFEATKNIPTYIKYLMANDAYEKGDIELINNYLTSVDRAAVVGAGVGIVACAIGMITDDPVIAIEPNPKLVGIIENTFRLNSLNVHVINSAVSENEGKEKFYLAKEYWSSSFSIPDTGFDECIDVDCSTLEDASSDSNVLFIDVEGAEKHLFNNGVPEYINKLFVEIHEPNLGEKASMRVINKLIKSGFNIHDKNGLTYYFIK